jgi:hypothetical protein
MAARIANLPGTIRLTGGSRRGDDVDRSRDFVGNRASPAS